MDIGFYDRSIDAELLAVLQVEFHGGLLHEMIDGCQRGGVSRLKARLKASCWGTE